MKICDLRIQLYSIGRDGPDGWFVRKNNCESKTYTRICTSKITALCAFVRKDKFGLFKESAFYHFAAISEVRNNLISTLLVGMR